MSANLSALFPQPLPCITIEERTGLDGWFEYRVILLGSEARKTLAVFSEHPAALIAAQSIGNARGLPVADLSKDDYPR